MNKILCFATLLFSMGTYAEVHQCKVNGSLVFQDKPCAGSKQQAQQIREKQNEFKNAQAKRDQEDREWKNTPSPKIGMTTNQARDSKWGDPDKINKTTTAKGMNEQWVYRRSHQGSKYLYFENGILTAIQD
ncbi:hypothetical protein ABFO63_10370 [Acinetobacter junii]|uniref:hypothetical protein n=1 Tax=Acinetobacter junii TaxID=40215 RepID=UPI0032128B63